MTHPLSELIELGGPALGLPDPALPAASLDRAGAMADELSALLDHKNGFYAFESALRVLPARSCGPEIGLVEWNYEKLWIDEYRGMADGLLSSLRMSSEVSSAFEPMESISSTRKRRGPKNWHRALKGGLMRYCTTTRS